MYIWIIALFAIPVMVLALYKLFGNEAKRNPLNVILMATSFVVAICKGCP